MEDSADNKSGKKKKGFSPETLDKAAYVASAATAIGIGDNAIKHEYYMKHKGAEDVPGIKEARKDRHHARQDIFNGPEPENRWSLKRAFDLRREENKFASEIKKTFEKTGMYNDAQYFIALDSTAKWNVFEKVATVSGIVLAASLALARAVSRDDGKSSER